MKILDLDAFDSDSDVTLKKTPEKFLEQLKSQSFSFLPDLPQINDRILDEMFHDRSNYETLLPPNNAKYKVLNRMIKLLESKDSVETFHLAKCIHPKITRTQFNDKQKAEVKNRIRILNKKLSNQGLFIKSKSGFYSLNNSLF